MKVRMKKKLLVLLFAVTFLSAAIIMATGTSAETLDNGLWYSIENDEVTIGGYSGSATEVIIPETIEGYPVTKIRYNAFLNCESLESVTIPDSVKTIGDWAFYNCSSLKSITIPDSVKTIGDAVFCYCASLENVTLGNSVTDIGASAFCGCTSLISITIPDSVTTIASDAFSECGGLESVIIGNGVESINDSTFSECTGLTNVTIGNSVTRIGASAFYGCTSLESVTIPDSVTSIDINAFYLCSGLVDVIIGNGVTSVGANAFYDCTSLANVSFGDSVASIGGRCFYDCRSLENVYISNLAAWCNISFDSSDSTPFNYADALYINGELATEIIIPDGVTRIGDRAFYNCKRIESVTIPDSVGSIGSNAFAQCTGLTDVTIGNGVASIGKYAFFACKNLANIIIPGGVANIDDDAFYECSGLVKVTISDSVTNIGNYAFGACGAIKTVFYLGTPGQWQEITVGEGNSYLTDATIICCHHEKATRYEATEATCAVPGYTDGVYCSDCDCWIEGHEIIIVSHTDADSDKICDACAAPEGLLFSITDDEVTVTGYRGNEKDLVIPNAIGGCTVTCIGSSAFSTKSGIKSITLPGSVTSIETHAFAWCSNLENINLPSSLTDIGSYAFYWCAIKDIIIPDGVTSLEKGAFAYCQKLEKITISKGVTSIDSSAFYRCSYIESITVESGNKAYHSEDNCLINTKTKTLIVGCKNSIIPDDGSVTGIGDSAFCACSGLEIITIPKGVTNIGDSAFCDCSNLKSITIPESVISVNSSAFFGCGSLTAIYYGGSESQWNNISGINIDFLTNAKVIFAKKDCKHIYDNACDKSCNLCGQTRTVPAHKYAAATCTKAKTCSVCKATTGKALGHKYDNKCDTSCNRCKATRKITHTYKTTTTKATLAKNGSIVKKCTVCGNVASKAVIKYAKTLKLAANTFVYNAKAKTPAVTVKDSAGKVLKKGTDYTVTYAAGRINVGTYKVTVKMIGKYSGTKTLTFKINPQAVAISKTTAGVKSFTAAWAPKTAQVTGYEIQYSTAKNFSGAKKVTVTKAKNKSTTVKKLTKGKTYYVRIRTYKTVGKVKFFSAWSAVKTVTPKAK